MVAMKWIVQLLRGLLALLLALLLLFEEWGWEPLAALLARLANLPLWAALERQIARLPGWAALALLLVPMLGLLPVKLLALYLFSSGHAATGLALLLLAKLVGTALFARLFILTQPALMQLHWFARWYPRWKDWKDGWMKRIRASAPWRAGRRAKTQVRRWLQRR